MKWLLFPGGVGLGQNTFLVIAGEQMEAVTAPAANPSKHERLQPQTHKDCAWAVGGEVPVTTINPPQLVPKANIPAPCIKLSRG